MPAADITLTPEQARSVKLVRTLLDENGPKSFREGFLRLSVLEYSRVLQTSPGVVRGWEQKSRRPSVKFALRIADLLNTIERS